MMDLFGNGSDAITEQQLSINQSYAERYHHNKRRQQLEQLKEKYGPNADLEEDEDESDSEDVTEDEDGEQLTPQMDAAILRTLQRIRNKETDLYDPKNRVFDTEQAALQSARMSSDVNYKSNSRKKMTLQDYQRSRMLDAMKHSSDPAKDFAEATVHNGKNDDQPIPTTHDDEQEAIRAEFLRAAQDSEGQDDLFQVRKAEGGDESTYHSILMGALGKDASEDKIRELLRDHTHDESRSKENEDFLMNYILNRGWVESDIPSSTSEPARNWDAEAEDLDSEASFDSAAEAFEHAYNFRFEDPSLAQKSFAIESFPRHSEDSIRRPDDRRKKARHDRAARKKEEKDSKMRELNQLKALKRQEIAEKLKKLREVSGSDNRMDGHAFDGIDFDADFDPAEHDRLMQSQFDDEYYAMEDREKPRWDGDWEIDDIISSETKPEKKKKQKRASEEGMDADFVDNQDAKLSKKERKALKKKEKKAAKNKGKQEHEVDADDMDADKTESQITETDRKQKARDLMDEYYNLGYEDMIGDTPTRFKYASVPKDNYGLSAVEILLADDADLNNVVGLKHLQPYRRGPSKPSNLKKRLKRFREDLDAREQPVEQEERPKKKRLGKKERQKLKTQDSTL